jgi:Uma2 family endonuclease
MPNVETDIPTIVVEFVSSRRRDVLRDYELKRDEYHAAGVEEYWVIDRFRRMMTVYYKGSVGPTYKVVAENESYQTRLLPGFVLPLARLFAQADDWPKTKRSRKLKEQKPPAGESHG